jgi:hypothetical protein
VSFTRIHTAEATVDGSTLWLGVYADGSANLIIDEKDYVTIDPHEDDRNVDASNDVCAWLGRELKIGRSGAAT